jgi:hypothetical protein
MNRPRCADDFAAIRARRGQIRRDEAAARQRHPEFTQVLDLAAAGTAAGSPTAYPYKKTIDRIMDALAAGCAVPRGVQEAENAVRRDERRADKAALRAARAAGVEPAGEASRPRRRRSPTPPSGRPSR